MKPRILCKDCPWFKKPNRSGDGLCGAHPEIEYDIWAHEDDEACSPRQAQVKAEHKLKEKNKEINRLRKVRNA